MWIQISQLFDKHKSFLVIQLLSTSLHRPSSQKALHLLTVQIWRQLPLRGSGTVRRTRSCLPRWGGVAAWRSAASLWNPPSGKTTPCTSSLQPTTTAAWTTSSWRRWEGRTCTCSHSAVSYTWPTITVSIPQRHCCPLFMSCTCRRSCSVILPEIRGSK